MARFVPRQRKHKVVQRLKSPKVPENSTEQNSNAVEIIRSHKDERSDGQKSLKEHILSQQNIKGSKKRKRLDKYIDKKLRKEESLDLIKRLASSKVDTSKFLSSSNLGRQALASGQERDFPSGTAFGASPSRSLSPQSSNGLTESRETSGSPELLPSPSEIPRAAIFPQSLGSGLKRPHGDNGIEPVPIKKRRRLESRNTQVLDTSQSSWEGFSSASDSEASLRSKRSQTDSEKSSSEISESGEESDESTASSNTAPGQLSDRRKRSSAFKAWASQQVNEATDFHPSYALGQNATTEATKIKVQLRPPEIEPLPPELESNGKNLHRKTFSVQVERRPHIQESRLNLPVVAEEQKIMEAIHSNPVVVIWGATGSGKTTQVPQFLYEAGFGNKESPNPGMIGVTQPRRVAAVSMAKRVGEELGDPEDHVSYQIRFDSNISHKTVVKFMTDGILIREIAEDFSLSKYSIIIIDEAHERSTNTDILIGMMSRIVDLREAMSKENEKVSPLKLVIMSANLRISDFLENTVLFRGGPPPLLQTEGRQYPVTIHFTRRTQRDYVEEAFQKVCKGHRRLPPGGMLVFLTGQNEIELLSRKLKDALASPSQQGAVSVRVRLTAKDAPLEAEDMEQLGEEENFDNDFDQDEDEDQLIGEGEDEFETGDGESPSSQVLVLPLFSQLQTKEQLRVFDPPPKDTRLIVLATNVAETSITIPSIRYVFDCGRAKSKTYDQATSVQSFEIGWISKASASQRAGRAGRTGPGHCYRLYSSAVYERDFQEHTEPEILRMPAEGVVLQLKSMDLENVVNFPFPTPPDRRSLAKAEKLLTYLGAISDKGKVTPTGRDIATYPLSPRFAKMLAIGHQHKCMPYTIALVAALAIPNVLLPEGYLHSTVSIKQPDDSIYTIEQQLADEKKAQRISAYRQAQNVLSTHSQNSDAIKTLTALCAYANAANKGEFCQEMFLSQKAVSESALLFAQLSSIVHKTHPSLLPEMSRASLGRLPSPAKEQITALQQFVAAGFIDQVAILASESPQNISDLGRRPTRAIDVPYLPLFPIASGQSTEITDIAVWIHPSSVLAQRSVKELPRYIVYRHLQRSAPSTVGDSKTITKTKTRMHPLTTVTGKQLANLAKGTSLLEYSKPVGKIEETEEGKKRVCWVVPSLTNKSGGMGWPLPAVKVVQVKQQGGWKVEEVIG